MGNLEEETCNQRPSTITSRTSPTSEATCHPRPTSPSSTHSEAAQTVQSSHTPLAGTATSPPSTWHRRPAFLAPHQEPPQLPKAAAKADDSDDCDLFGDDDEEEESKPKETPQEMAARKKAEAQAKKKKAAPVGKSTIVFDVKPACFD